MCMDTLRYTDCDVSIIVMYADDLVILITGPDLKVTMKDKLENQIKIVKNWAMKQGLKLSTAKTNIIAFHNPKQKPNLNEIKVDGENIPVTNHAMYLGVNLDKNLNFKKHVENKTNAVTNAARPLSHLMSMKWGLSAAQGRYIHDNLLMKNLTYAAGIWGQKALQSQTLTRKLQTAQNNITRRITGGQEHTQHIVLTVMAGVETVKYHINRESIINYCHLKSHGNWWKDPFHEKRAHLTHSKAMANFLASIGASGEIDQTEIRTTTFANDTTREHIQTINIYTDGSRIETNSNHKTGAGAIIYLQEIEIKLKKTLAPENTINQAELMAIQIVVEKLLELGTTDTHIKIHTDSSTTLMRLTRGETNSKQVVNTTQKLLRLQENNSVEIVKVKAHTNIEGNEIADQLAKEATTNSNTTKNELALTKAQIINNMTTNARKQLITDLNESKYAKFTTTVMTKIIRDHKKTQWISKITMRSMTLAISNQNNLRSALHHRDHSIDPKCELCGTKENSEHKLLDCPDLDFLRHTLDFQNIKENIYDLEQKLDLNKLTKLITKSDGSRIETNSNHKTGAGAIIYLQEIEIKLKKTLAPENTINQAELMAIQIVVEKLLELGTTDTHIKIHTDSSTTLMRLTRGETNSKQVVNTTQKLLRLQENNSVEIVKVKAHTNIEGNEIADQLAKEATTNSNTTKNELALTKAQIINNMTTNARKQLITDLNESKYAKFTTTVMTKIIRDHKKTQWISKITMRSMTLAISNQNNLRSALHHRDHSIDPKCELCGTKENSEHKLLDCPDLDFLRHTLDFQNIKENIYDLEQKLDLNKLITKSDGPQLQTVPPGPTPFKANA
eukprot:sb/3462056/